MEQITFEPIDLAAFLSQKPPVSSGATAIFVGTVRNFHEGRSVIKLRYECYEAMAVKQLQMICTRARADFGVSEIKVIHRCGELAVGEAAVAILVHAKHRDEAFRASRFVIERIKDSVPIWKHEFYEDGSHQWVYCIHAEPQAF